MVLVVEDELDIVAPLCDSLGVAAFEMLICLRRGGGDVVLDQRLVHSVIVDATAFGQLGFRSSAGASASLSDAAPLFLSACGDDSD